MATVGDWLEILDDWYPPSWAEDWDNPGLQVGDRRTVVTRVLVALDPTAQVIDEAAVTGCQLLLTHHPLVFRPLPDVDLARPDAIAVWGALRSGVSVVACHTNADVASPGVSDALAETVGLGMTSPLASPRPGVPTGLGRIATTAAPSTVGAFAEHCASALDSAVRVVGDPGRTVEKVALCGGSGSSLIEDAARSGADVYLTADVKHHAALDALARGLAIIDAGHFATEWPWIPELAGRLLAEGPSADVLVSEVKTDPFVRRATDE